MTDAPKRRHIAGLLRERITSGLHLGLLEPGDRLPSARDLHASLGVDARVVAAAYHDLAADGLVQLRPRAGARVAGLAAANGRPSDRDWIVDLLLQSVARDIGIVELAGRLAALATPGLVRAVCIECNADQLHSLGAELERFYGIVPVQADLERLDRGDHEDDLRQADVLVTTSFHAARARELGRRFRKPWIAVSLREDLMGGVITRLAEGPVYFVGTDPRFAAKVVEIGRGLGFGGNARPVILGRDSPDLIPPDAPVVIMTRAVPLLEGTALLARARPPSRSFGLDATRRLLHLIVEATGLALDQRVGKPFAPASPQEDTP